MVVWIFSGSVPVLFRHKGDSLMRLNRVIALICLVIATIFAVAGCETSRSLRTSYAPEQATVPTPGPSYLVPSEPASCDTRELDHLAENISPEAMIDYASIHYTPISLEECIRKALSESEVFRDLGGAIVAQPGSVGTSIDPAIIFSDPSTGEDAALSAFDANVEGSLFIENNDRPFNNPFSGDSNGLFSQDLGNFNLEFNKLAATGTQFTARTTVNYDANNQAGNRFGSSFETIIDSGFSHPLLQGSGSLFNRIAGPSQTPGSFNGILIARTNTEISLTEFETSVRDFVSNVENAYWDLYYAYRELNAQTDARDAAFIVFEQAKNKSESQRGSGLEAASAEEQYLRFESSIIESLEGRLLESTQVSSGTSGGVFRRTVGVRVAERRLRYLIGMPISDGSLLQPADQPITAPLQFDWDQSVAAALSGRPETRRQRWIIKQRELELTAAKNFLLPRLDLVGNYRFRGLGRNLTGSGTLADDINADLAGLPSGSSAAFTDLFSGNFQELQLGAQFQMPIGFRRAHAGVRNAQLSIQRERAVMREQERRIVLDLSNAVAETRRAYTAMDIAERRYNAAVQYRENAIQRIKLDRVQYDVLLEAQRRILESQLQFINAEVEYSIAIKNVHFERGTFLAYHGISMSESESSEGAYQDYQERISRRTKLIDYVVRDAKIATGPVGVATEGCNSCSLAEGCGAEQGEIVDQYFAGAPLESHGSLEAASSGSHPNTPVYENTISTEPVLNPPAYSVPPQPTTGTVVQMSISDGPSPSQTSRPTYSQRTQQSATQTRLNLPQATQPRLR